MSQSTPKTVPSLLAEPRYEIVPLPGVIDAVTPLPRGTVVTVTSSPRRGAYATVELTERLAARGMRAVPHIAARQLRDEARRRGITLPLVAGVPGVVDTGTLLRMSPRVGVGDSVRFVRGNTAAITRLLNPRGYRPDGLVRRLGVDVRDGRCQLAGLHFYTFNRVGSTVRWLDHARRNAAA